VETPLPSRPAQFIVTRFATILMFIGAVLAGGGSRFAHVMVAHSGAGSGAGSGSYSCPTALGMKSSCHAHAHSHGPAHTSPCESRTRGGQQTSSHSDDCATCDELASLTPTVTAPFALLDPLEVCATLDDREAAQVADPAPIAALAARPPPACA